MNRLKTQPAVLLLVLACAAALAQAADVEPAANGWAIDAGSLGRVVVEYPLLRTSDGALKPDGPASIAEGVVTLSYASGAKLKATPTDEGYRLHFTHLPASVKGLKFGATLPIAWAGKATFAVDDASPQVFPAAKPEKATLYGGNGRKLVVAGADDDGFAVAIEHGYQQLQDNRVWNDKKFYWFASADLPRTAGNQSYFTLAFPGVRRAEAPAAKPPVATPKQPKPKAEASVKVELTDDGVRITAGSAGDFTLEYPKLTGLDPAKPTEVKRHSSTHASLAYVDGSTAEARLDDGQVQFAFKDVSAKAGKLRMDMRIPFVMAEGGSYAIGDSARKLFPAEKPDSPHLHQGAAKSFTSIHPTGPGFTIHVPEYSYQQLQDNREWNWRMFAWFFVRDRSSSDASPTLTIRVTEPLGGAAKSEPVIDRFGQWIDRDYPTKVHSEDELKADLAHDRAYYASLTPPERDSFGGFLGTGKKYGLKKTGFFRLGKVANADVLVTPEGNAFFQLGVCCLGPVDEYTLVKGREAIYEWLPGAKDPTFKSAWRPNNPGVFSFHLANMIRKTGEPYDEATYVRTWIDREKKWGFNSLGAFVGTGYGGVTHTELVRRNYPYVNFLPLGGLPQVQGATKVWDPFADGIEEEIEQRFAEHVARSAEDPLLIGSFIANEPSVEDVPKVVPMLKASESASKRRLVERLQSKYGGIGAFNEAWGLSLTSFADARERALTVRTEAAAADVQAFFAEFLGRRYRLVAEAFRKHDPNHLLIGDRWMPGTSNNELMVRAAGKYLDVVSINYYTEDPDVSYLSRIREWSGGKPMLLSEFYFTSPATSGLQGGNRMATQRERGLAYRHYVEHAAATGYVVGIQWFLNMDQASTGRFFQRFNGEANNTGLVNVADRPYKDMLAEMMKTNYDLLPVLEGEREPYTFDDPRFRSDSAGGVKTVAIYRMTNPFEADGVRGEWPGVPSNRVEPVGDQSFGAEFRLAWDDANLYLYAEVADPTPMRNSQPGSSIWNGDALEVFIGTDKLGQRGTMIFSDRQVLLRGAESSGELAPAYIVGAEQQAHMDAAVVRQIDGKGYVVEAAIPFASLGFEPKLQQELMFDLAIDDGDGERRIRQLVFNGTKLASKDRGVWGRAQLVP